MMMVACSTCKRRSMDTRWRSSKQRDGTEVVCGACGGTGWIRIEETLPCAKCQLNGELKSSLVYQDIIGRLVVWRCSFGHDWTELVTP